jgi:hypothetical protein
MLVVASTVMVDDKRAGRPVRWSARTAFTAGVLASIAANIAAAAPTPGARVVAAWPAVALLLVVEMLTRAPGRPASETADAPADVTQGVSAVATTSGDGLDLRPDIALDPSTSSTSRPTRRRTRGTASGTAGPVGPRQRTPAATTTMAITDVRARRPDASIPEIAAAVGVSERHVRRLLTHADQQNERHTAKPPPSA